MRFSTTSVILLRKTKRRSDFLVSFFVIFLFVAVAVIAVMGWGTPALAAPPGSPYAPGETLDPSCAPGAANCTVTSGITGQSTSTFVSFYLTSSTLGGDSSFSFNSSTKVLTIGTSTITGLTFTNASGTNLTTSGFLQGGSLSVSGVSTLQGITFTNATGTNLMVTNLIATSFTLSNLIATGTISADIINATSGLTFANATSAGNLQVGTFSATTVSSTNVSSTNITASGYGTFPTLNFTNASGTNITASGFLQGASGFITNISSTNITASGFFQGATLNISGQSSLASVSSTNILATGYLTVQGVSTLATTTVSSSLSIGTSTAVTDALLTIATSTNILTVLQNGFVGIGTAMPSSTLHVSGIPTQTASSSLVLIGSSILQGGNASGTYLGINAASGYGGDFLNFQVNSSTKFLVTSSSVAIGTSTVPAGSLFTVASTSANIFTILQSRLVGIATSSPTGRLHIVGIATSTGTGTVTSSVTFGDLSINGTSTTLFGTEVLVGDLLFAGDQFRIVTAIGSATSAMVNAPFFPALTNATSFSVQKPILKLTDDQQNDVFTVHGNGMVTADQTQFGSLIFPEDAGMVGWADMSASSTLAAVPVGYAASIDGINLLTLMADSDGSGGIRNSRVIIGQPATSTSRSSSSIFISNFFTVASDTPHNASGSLVFFGDGYNLNGGSASGTVLGINMATTTFGDFLNFQVNSSTKFKVTSSGSLAIATSSSYGATSTLTVCALSNCTAPTTASSTDTVAFFASTGGLTTDISIVARGVITSGLADVGEYVEVVGDPGSYQAGEMLSARMIGSTSSVQNPVFERSPIPYDRRLVGVVTKTAGLVAGGGEEGHGQVILALAGRVPVIVSFKNGPIEAGDSLTSSDVPGVAMKATKAGRVAGVALTSLAETSAATGTVMMFANPHWFAGSEIAATSTFDGSGGDSSQVGDSLGLFGQILSAVKDWFSSIKEWAVDKLTATIIISGRVETDVLKTNGIEMPDRATGELYCVVLENGEFVKTPGACPSTSSGQADSGQASSSDPVVPPPLPPPDSTSTLPVVPPTDSTSTPPEAPTSTTPSAEPTSTTPSVEPTSTTPVTTDSTSTPPVVTPPSSEPTSTETAVIPVEPPVVSEPPAAPPSDSPPADPATAPPPADSAPVN